MLQKLITEIKTSVIAFLIALLIAIPMIIIVLMLITPLLPVVKQEIITGKVNKVIYETPYDPYSKTTVSNPKLLITVPSGKVISIKGAYRIYHSGDSIRLKKQMKNFGITDYKLVN